MENLMGKGKHDQLQVLLKKINKVHPKIKFDQKRSQEEIKKIDTNIYIDDNKNIQKTIYQKETDRQS